MSSTLLPVYNGKLFYRCKLVDRPDRPMECGSYRAIELLDHAMKVIERVLERRIRQKLKIDTMQFGFMPGKELQMQFSQ